MKTITSLVLCIFLYNYGYTQKNFIDQNYIEVNGTAELKVVPDEIYIGIFIDENDKKGKVPVEEQEAVLIKRLKALGIDTAKNLKIKDANSDLKNYFLKKDDVIKTKHYELKVNATKDLKNVFTLLDAIDISNASVVKVNHSKMQEFRQQVKIDAIKAAKKKALYLSEALDQTIGKALFIQELQNNNYNLLRASSNSISYYNDINKITENPDFTEIVIDAKIAVKFALE